MVSSTHRLDFGIIDTPMCLCQTPRRGMGFMWIGCWGRRALFDPVQLVMTAARAFSLSLRSRLCKPFANPAPSRREPRSVPRLDVSSAGDKNQPQRRRKRLPPGGSWQRRKAMTEGERGSDTAVKLQGCGQVSSPPMHVCERPHAGLWAVRGLDAGGGKHYLTLYGCMQQQLTHAPSVAA